MLRQLSICATWALLVALVPSAEAQTILRWELKAGEKLPLEITQETTAKVAYSGKETTTKINLALKLEWEVLRVDAGKATIQQRLSQVTAKIESPNVGTLEYDSSASAKPVGKARDLAAAMEPLLKAPLELTMDARGDVSHVTLSENAATKPAKAADNAARSPLLDEAVLRVLRQPLVLLPEKPVNVDQTWSRETELGSEFGAGSQTTTYRYVGASDFEGMKLEKIEATTGLNMSGSAKSGQPTIKEQTQDSEYLFSAAKGHLVSATQKQKLVTERPYRETTIVVSLESKQETRVR